MNECSKLMLGPLGSCVGRCELERGHDGACRVNGFSEQDMVDQLNKKPDHDGHKPK